MAISPNIGEAFARVGDAALAEIRPRRSGGGRFPVVSNGNSENQLDEN